MTEMMTVLRAPVRMDPVAKRYWLDGLRSERYPQGTSALHRGDRYCCLGVLCEVARDHGLNIAADREIIGDEARTYYDSASQYLPASVVEWGRLDGEDPAIEIDEEIVDWWVEEGIYSDMPFALHQTTTLSDLNDNGVPFALIAGLIERQL